MKCCSRPGRPSRALACLAAAGLLAACGGGGSASPAVEGRAGDLEVVNAFLPRPASPSVAAVYLTVRNSGSSPDVLTDISTPDAQTSMLMAEVGTASTGDMQALDHVAIPANGQATLAPGHDHAMLENPTVALKVGQRLPLTLHFARAGSLTIQVPVVPLTAIMESPGAGMGNMPGM